MVLTRTSNASKHPGYADLTLVPDPETGEMVPPPPPVSKPRAKRKTQQQKEAEAAEKEAELLRQHEERKKSDAEIKMIQKSMIALQVGKSANAAKPHVPSSSLKPPPQDLQMSSLSARLEAAKRFIAAAEGNSVDGVDSDGLILLFPRVLTTSVTGQYPKEDYYEGGHEEDYEDSDFTDSVGFAQPRDSLFVPGSGSHPLPMLTSAAAGEEDFEMADEG